MTAVASGAPARAKLGSFYTWAALACVLAAFLGFAPTYWAPVAAGKFQANPIVHIHGLIFFAWTLFFLVQSSLPSSGRLALHRSLGMVGISLVTLMTVMALLVALNSQKMAIAFHVAERGEAFLIVPLVGIATFAVLMAVAFANIRRPEVHKRLMLCATCAILGAPIARPFLTWVFKGLPPGPPPVEINYVGLIGFLPIVAGMIHDVRTRGRPHPAYVVTLPILVFLIWVVIPLSATDWWHGVARGFVELAGRPPALPPGA